MSWNEETCAYADENGQLECLKYAHENGCPWNEETCAIAAKMVTWRSLRYAHENGCPGSAIMRILFHARKNPRVKKERKKERKERKKERERQDFLLYDSSFNITHFIISSSSLLLVLLLLLSSVMKVSFIITMG